jgi:hypothetical protein
MLSDANLYLQVPERFVSLRKMRLWKMSCINVTLTITSFLKFDIDWEFNNAELVHLADVARAPEGCGLLLLFGTALPTHGCETQGELCLFPCSHKLYCVSHNSYYMTFSSNSHSPTSQCITVV